jgi:hypothetical protein
VAPTFDPYSALGVPRDATQAQISAARRRLSREYHPDACIDSGAADSGRSVWQPVQDQVSQQVTSAYQWLRTGTMVFRDPGGQSPRGEFFFDCGLDTPAELPTDVTVP